MSGTIYAIQAVHGGPVKIGYTSTGDANSRLASLQTGNPSRLVVRGTISGSLATEKEIHHALRGHESCGEWFVVNETSAEIIRSFWETDLYLGDPLIGDLVSISFDQRKTYRWNLRGGMPRGRGKLHLYWEALGDPISDDYTPDETSPQELFAIWDRWLSVRGIGDCVPIYWFVSSPDTACFEAAPFTGCEQDWLTYYDCPVDDESLEPIKWASLPVVNKRWNQVAGDKGGFIQELTRWRPSPFQPSVSLSLLKRLAQTGQM